MTTRIPIGAIRLLAGATAALAVAGTLVACSKTTGSGAAAANTPAPASSGSSSPSPSGSRAARGLRPAAQGTIAALAAASMEVQSPQSGQVTVTFGPKTAFTATSATTKSAVVVGTCVAAMAARSPSSGSAVPSSPAPSASPPPRVTSFTAATVTITQPVNGTCNAGFGGPNGSGAPGPGGPPSGAFPSGTPSGGFGRGGFGDFARATGKVSAIAASTMTVVGNTRTGSITYTVTVDPSTMYTTTGRGTATSLAVGKCVIAFGSTNSAGAVAATRIAVSPASSSGCTTAGFGRGRFGGASSSTGG